MQKIFLVVFQHFGTQNRKVSILFYVHEGPKIKKLNANFSILGPKNVEKMLKIYGLQWSLVFKIKFSWKSEEQIYRVFYLVNVGQKRRFNLKLTFSSLSATLIWNAKHVWKVAFWTFFIDVFRNPKILEEYCDILSQYGAT